MERLLTFIDVDENRLELWLKRDRVQLVVIDSRPELEAAELRRFASVLFAEYVARDLGDRLGAARSRLQEARDRVTGADPAAGTSDPGARSAGAAGGELVAALDGALRAIEDLAAAVAIPAPVATEAEPDAPVVELEPADPEPAVEPAQGEPIVLRLSGGNRPYPSLQAMLRAARKRPPGGGRAEESSTIRWGGVAIRVDGAATDAQ